MNMADTFTIFTSLSVTQVWMDKFTTFIFTHMMKKELNFYQVLKLMVFMDKTFWNSEKDMNTLSTDYFKKLI